MEQQNGKYAINNEVFRDIKESLQTIESRTNALITFVNAYRNFTSLPKPEFQKFILNKLIKQVISLLKTNIQEAGINVYCHIKPDNLTVRGDWNLLETALINIVTNAVEVLKKSENPEINITGGKTMDNHVFIEIRDNGPGIPEDIADQVFIPFYSTKNNGSGIGLSLARQIIQLHQGRISLDSKPHEYTRFIVVI